MKADAVRLLFIAIALIVAAGIQEVLPAFGGVKMPLLLAFSLAAASAWFLPAPFRAGAALAGGYFTGALSDLPFACAEFFFFAAGWVVSYLFRHRETRGGDWLFGLAAAGAASGAMQVWLYIWGTPGTGGSILSRALPAIVAGAPAGAVFFALIDWTGERLGFKE